MLITGPRDLCTAIADVGVCHFLSGDRDFEQFEGRSRVKALAGDIECRVKVVTSDEWRPPSGARIVVPKMQEREARLFLEEASEAVANAILLMNEGRYADIHVDVSTMPAPVGWMFLWDDDGQVVNGGISSRIAINGRVNGMLRMSNE